MDDLPDTVERLAARLEALERRVEALEHPAPALSASAAQQAGAGPATEAAEGFSLQQAGGAFPVLGKALLGIAGAYLLRAVAESSSLPRLAIAAIAIAYALLWLVGAARVQAGAWFASAVYAGTSALILAPMLWELTLGFRVLQPAAAAGILGVFVLAASALAWKRDLAPVFWVANGTAAVAALALGIATHQLLPFIAALLLMALIAEAAAERNHELSVRPLVAVAVDLAVWALIFIYSSPPSTRQEYPGIGAAGLLWPGCVLFSMYAASVTVRTALHGQKITVFETVQAMAAFLLAASSVLYLEPRSGGVALGVACLLLSAACYALAFAIFEGSEGGRNRRIFGFWAAGLLLAGAVLGLPEFWMTVCLGAAAIGATVLGVRMNRATLEFHGMAFLLGAAMASGLPGYVFQSLAGTLPVSLAGSVAAASACALLCYAAGTPAGNENWRRQLLRLVPAALAAGALAALTVDGLFWLVSLRISSGAQPVAFLRTLTLCALALALAFGGCRLRRVELTRIAYATLGFVAVKLLFEDLRQGHLEFIAASIFLFAIALLTVPRLGRMGRKA